MLYRRKPIGVKAVQFDTRKPYEGVKRLPPRKVRDAARGIEYNAPEQYVVEGHNNCLVVVLPGDWLVYEGNRPSVLTPDQFACYFEPCIEVPAPLRGLWHWLIGGRP